VLSRQELYNGGFFCTESLELGGFLAERVLEYTVLVGKEFYSEFEGFCLKKKP